MIFHLKKNIKQRRGKDALRTAMEAFGMQNPQSHKWAFRYSCLLKTKQ